MKKLMSLVSWTAFAAATSSTASAGIVYQSVPSIYEGGGVACSNCGIPLGGDDVRQVADSFTPNSWTTITGFDIVTSSSTYPWQQAIPDLEVYGSEDPTSSLLFYSTDIPSVVNTYGQFDVFHGNIFGTLSAGHQYWISSYSQYGELVAIGPGYNNGAVEWTRYLSGQWESTYPLGGDLEYILYGYTSVPEPATWAMLILGVVMIGFAARGPKAGIAFKA